MTFDILGRLNLKALIGRHIGSVNADSLAVNGPFIIVNGPFVIVTGIPQSSEKYGADHGNRATPNNGSAIINLDKETQSVPVSQDSKNAVPISPLPIDFGIYLRFEDPQWWEKVPDFMDVTETLRIISITRRRLSFPAIYNGKTREIAVNCKGDSMTIRQGLDNSPSLDLKNIHPRGKIRACFQQAHSENKWSLLRIRAGEVTDLKLSSRNIVLYYGQEFAECVWALVHHHRNRGDEAYILIRKKDLTDD